jgi:hypothetical protein
VNLSYFRPLAFGPHRFASDIPVIKLLSEWCREIRLGGHTYDLNPDPQSLFQITSQNPYYLKYGVWVYDRKLLADICERSPIKDKKFATALATRIRQKGGEPAFGIVTIAKRHWYLPASRKKWKAEKVGPTSFVIEDVYRLLVFDEEFRALAVVTAFETLPFLTYRERDDLESSIAEFFPNIDYLMLSWHEVPLFFQRPNIAIYHAAAARLARIRRRISGYLDDPEAGEIISSPFKSDESVVTSFDDPNPNLYQSDPLIRAQDLRQYRRVVISDVYTGAGQLIPRHLMPIDTMGLSERDNPFSPPYSPLTSDANVEAAVVRAFASAFSIATYIGNGTFAVPTASLRVVAAGNGAWGSAEALGITAIVGGLGGPGVVAAGGAAAGAGALATSYKAHSSYTEGERYRRQAANECNQKPNAKDCIDCYGRAVDKLEGAEGDGTAAAIGGGLAAAAGTAAIIAAPNVWNPVGWILAIAAIALGTAAAITGIIAASEADDSLDQIHSDCDQLGNA